MTSQNKNPQVNVDDNLVAVRANISEAAGDVRRDLRGFSLVAVSKSQPTYKIEAALRSGHRVFGENRIQETRRKWPSLKNIYPEITLHLIGPLQSNKTADAVELFDVIQTLDREKLAVRLAQEMKRQDRRPELFIQVNTGEEPQKAGVMPAEADPFIQKCLGDYDLPVVGLMCIPPRDENPALHFALLGTIAERNGLCRLSMGMSDDYPTAVRLGATEVRVGTAIFGSRA
ncbi:MAG: YggS family pyridoxal phosphate-dependent enzyme [Rhodospirillaceae bacterium]|nr:MAG: YggS family pyridoxal phosphate-dependent enzyme [Rhodospirillaceae bacterium]